jgi:hypothetical protein
LREGRIKSSFGMGSWEKGNKKKSKTVAAEKKTVTIE